MQFTFSIFTLYLHLYFLVKQSGEGNHFSSIKPLIALSHQFVVINSYHIHKKKNQKKSYVKKKKILLINVFGFRCRFKWLSLYLQLWILKALVCQHVVTALTNNIFFFIFCLYLFITSVKTLDPKLDLRFCLLIWEWN